MASDEEISEIRKQAAQLEIYAAYIRVETAKAEQESAMRTIQMSEMVAQTMLEREGITQLHNDS